MLVREYLSYPVPTLLFFPERRERITCGDGRVDGWTVGTCVVLDLVLFTVSSPRWTTCSMLSHSIDLFFVFLRTLYWNNSTSFSKDEENTGDIQTKDLTRSIRSSQYNYCLLAYRQGRTVGGLHTKNTAVFIIQARQVASYHTQYTFRYIR